MTQSQVDQELRELDELQLSLWRRYNLDRKVADKAQAAWLYAYDELQRRRKQHQRDGFNIPPLNQP